MIKDYNKEQLERFVKKSHSYKEVLALMGYKSSTSSIRILKMMINDFGISTEHFWTQNERKVRSNKELFRENSKVVQSVIRRRFKELESVPYVCSICGLPPEWQDKPLRLMMDHINGDHTDHRLENLRWVCPNCNSQLSTTGYHGVNKYDERGNRLPEEYIEEQSKNVRIKCPKCGRLMSQKDTQCKICADRERRDRTLENMKVSREDLKDLIRTKSFTEIGRMFGVSDNGIRKWCQKYDLPYIKKEIKSYTNAQWKKL